MVSGNDTQGLYNAGQELITYQAMLISEYANREQVYRLEVVKGKEEQGSQAAGEAVAKSTKAYSEYSKMKMLFDIVDQQIKFIKKIVSVKNDEYRNQD